ncbi:MAG: hypothetical protein BGP06_14080 [Rhizobiales bacterium 65-9]|nr:MAG: hypothetical protein BGP06_14080 [Rhizobiales bacterium 65-9]
MIAYERPLEDPSYPEIWCYADRLSYKPGDEVCVHASATTPSFELAIWRDGPEPRLISRHELSAPLTPLRGDFIASGCDWPVVLRWPVPHDLPSGFYLMLARAEMNGVVREQEHGFFVRSGAPGRDAKILLVAATSTWTAYNDWGGANHYIGHNVPGGFPFAPRLSTQRPFARGLIFSPVGAPRKPHAFRVERGAVPRYPPIEFSYTRGLSKFYSNAGWATYERPFCVWAERNGYRLDYATQTDLHYDEELLAPYDCVVLVGHDEYWTWEMREALDHYVTAGGHVARFGGNFFWQVRLEDGGRTQVCYKELAGTHDPLLGTSAQRRVTACWEDELVDWPGARSLGLNGAYGIYAHVGGQAPRASGGFTVYRPEHWAFAGTDAYYGDILGGDSRIFGYEVDGLDFTFRDGLPYPTFSDGAPPSVEILAMGLAYNTEALRGARGEISYYGDTAPQLARLRYREDTPEARERASRGSGMIVSFSQGRGAVFNAGSCEWVAGLHAADFQVEQMTRNVLDRFSGRGL